MGSRMGSKGGCFMSGHYLSSRPRSIPPSRELHTEAQSASVSGLQATIQWPPHNKPIHVRISNKVPFTIVLPDQPRLPRFYVQISTESSVPAAVSVSVPEAPELTAQLQAPCADIHVAAIVCGPSEPHYSEDPEPVSIPLFSLFPINGQPLAHNIFRQVLLQSRGRGHKPIRRVLQEQILRCELPEQILRVVALAMQRKETARELNAIAIQVIRAVYRTRTTADDKRALGLITTIIERFKMEGMVVHRDWLFGGIKFAARTRSLSAMKSYLEQIQEHKLQPSRDFFPQVIAKFSFGKLGLGEIRNGRWKRKELLQVLLGFDEVPTKDACHLETFLNRADWQHMYPWLNVLARCHSVEKLRWEWDQWLQSSARIYPKALDTTTKSVDSRVRGDYAFIEQMCCAGDIIKAWEILKISKIPWTHLQAYVQSMLLDEPQHATIWNQDVESSMLAKLNMEISKIEKACGATWISTGSDGAGHHVLPSNMESEALENLTDPKLLEYTPFGYPWDSDPVILQAQKELNEAKEAGLSAYTPSH